MPPPRTILKFSLWLLIFWGLLLTKWPGLEKTYAAAFRELGDVVFARFWFWPQATVRFLDPKAVMPGQLPPGVDAPKAQDVLDTVMVLENRDAPAELSFVRISSRLIGYLPTAIMIGLVLATPTTWKRRLLGLVWALLAVHAFIILRITVKLLVFYCSDKPVALFHPGLFWTKFWENAAFVIHEDPTVSLVVPVFIWFALMFRPSQWTAAQPKAPNAVPESGREKVDRKGTTAG